MSIGHWSHYNKPPSPFTKVRVVFVFLTESLKHLSSGCCWLLSGSTLVTHPVADFHGQDFKVQPGGGVCSKLCCCSLQTSWLDSKIN